MYFDLCGEVSHDICGLSCDCHAPLQDGSTALMFAAQSGHIEIVRLLLAHPHIEHSIKDNVSVCVCVCVCGCGYVCGCVQALVHAFKGADVNLWDRVHTLDMSCDIVDRQHSDLVLMVYY